MIGLKGGNERSEDSDTVCIHICEYVQPKLLWNCLIEYIKLYGDWKYVRFNGIHGFQVFNFKILKSIDHPQKRVILVLSADKLL